MYHEVSNNLNDRIHLLIQWQSQQGKNYSKWNEKVVVGKSYKWAIKDCEYMTFATLKPSYSGIGSTQRGDYKSLVVTET